MAYVPPHKRHQKSGGAAAVAPPSPALPPESVRNPRFKSNDILYAENAKPKWFIVGLADESRISDLTRLEPVSMEFFQLNSGLALVLKGEAQENGEDQASYYSENPSAFVAETVKQDLLSSFQKVKEHINNGCEFGELKPVLVARFGRVLFRGNSSFHFESIRGSSLPGETLRKLPRLFNTSVSPSFVEYITSEVVHRTNFTFEEDKQVYQIKISDKTRPHLTFTCKCRVTKDTNQLQLCKIELNNVRHLVADMSCLDKNLDMRLMLIVKRSFVDLTDEELGNIKSLINSAILDSEVKGGLRWPLGKQSSGDQYTVVQVCYTRVKRYRNSSMRLKVRHGDRFDFRSSHGEVAEEISLKMPGIVSQLMEQAIDSSDLAFEMLKENLELLWKHFLCT